MAGTALLIPLVVSAQNETGPPEEPDPAETVRVATDVGGADATLADGAPSSATQLDVIEVTASKHLKSQRDIPGSVGAIRGADLERIQAQGLKDYLKLVPGVVFPDQGTEESMPIIRGIATSVDLALTPANVGIYVDEMPFADLFQPISIPDLNPFDLERVEVLKGPQGTLFGSGALSGAIRYIVQKPSAVWEGKVAATIAQTENSDTPSQVVAGAINAPLLDGALALRGVGVLREEAGLYDMHAEDQNGSTIRDQKDADELAQRSMRLLASWQVSDKLNVSAFYFDQRSHRDDFSIADQTSEYENGSVPFASPRAFDFGGGNLSLNHDLGWGRLLSSSNLMTKDAYVVNHLEYYGVPDQNANEVMRIAGDTVDGYTQEFRLSSPDGGDDSGWEWLAGAAYLSYGNVGWGYYYIGPNRPDPTSREQITSADEQGSQATNDIDQVAEERSVFGEASRWLGDQWEATLGARYYRTRVEADTSICGAQILALIQQPCYVQQPSLQSKGLNPKASLRYLHSANIQAYLLIAKGFQFGGIQLDPTTDFFNVAAEQAGYSYVPYKSSTLWNYEVGVRTEWLERQLRFDVALFYQDWKDLQVTVIVPDPVTQAGLFALIANVGRAHSEGLEAALEVLPFAGARFRSSAAWISALTDEIFDARNSDGGVPSGTRLPGAPRFQWSNALSYERALPWFAGWSAGAGATHVHLGSSPDAIRPTGTVGGYDTFDARLFVVNPTLRFAPELNLGVNNLTDVRGLSYHTAGAEVLDYELAHFVQPRTVLASLSLKF